MQWNRAAHYEGLVQDDMSEIKKKDLPQILHDYFRALRFNPKHHLGLGDIRLTLDQQDNIVCWAEQACHRDETL